MIKGMTEMKVGMTIGVIIRNDQRNDKSLKRIIGAYVTPVYVP